MNIALSKYIGTAALSVLALAAHARYAPDRTERTARADLAALVDLGLTRRVGRGPGTRYVRTERPGPNIPQGVS